MLIRRRRGARSRRMHLLPWLRRWGGNPPSCLGTLAPLAEFPLRRERFIHSEDYPLRHFEFSDALSPLLFLVRQTLDEIGEYFCWLVKSPQRNCFDLGEAGLGGLIPEISVRGQEDSNDIPHAFRICDVIRD